MTSALTVSDFDFDLPPELIAQHPLPERAASRLLHVRRDGLDDLRFTDIERLARPGEVWVLNDTRVIKARLHGRKESGGKVEVLVERIVAPRRAWALVRTSHSPKPGTTFLFGDETQAVRAVVHGRREDFFDLEFEADIDATLARWGEVPLPPYIRHAAAADDEQRYQTVYAAQPGAVAAPTAGLHFTPALLDRLRERGVEIAYVTLHVGAGTFQPVRSRTLDEHVMHAELFDIPPATAAAVGAARAAGRSIVAVGTTSLRALESAASAPSPSEPASAGPVDHAWRLAAGRGETRLFVRPGYEFRIVDRLVTNFHLPKSTLLMLVAAFAGLDRIRAAYAHAIAARYRFFSYGDAMLLERAC